MKSHFPGMDPYLEAPWGDVHHRLTQYAADHLQTVLPPDLRSRVEERVFMESWDEPTRRPAPDVRIIERPGASEVTQQGSTATLTQPLVLEFTSEEITEGYVEIREAGDGARVITVIEVVSRSNKYAGEGRRKYLEKQRECHQSQVNLVEIDLLRAGQRVFPFPQDALPESYRTPYQVSVWRARDPDRYEYYAVALRERLPTIAIPLRETDEDAALDLPALLDEVYRKGRYDDLDYNQPPTPRLNGDDEAWANALLREKGLRTK